MRVAISGKGGVGKTALAATLARVLGRDSRPVLACDFDVNPGLAFSLGAVTGTGRLPLDAIVADSGAAYGYSLRADLAAGTVVTRYAAIAPDGVRLLAFGTIDGASHDLAPTLSVAREVAATFAEAGWDTIVDLEAGAVALYEGDVHFADQLLTVTDGSPAGNRTCRRLVAVATAMGGPPVGLVVTGSTPAADDAAERLPAELDVDLVGRVPTDDAVRRADVAGDAILDVAPTCAAVAAVRRLAGTLTTATEGVGS